MCFEKADEKMRQELATKADLFETKSELKADLFAVKSELKAEIEKLRLEMALSKMTPLNG